jgi:hypothetical protein
MPKLPRAFPDIGASRLVFWMTLGNKRKPYRVFPHINVLFLKVCISFFLNINP